MDEIALQKIVTEFNEDGNCIIEIAPNDTKDLEFRSLCLRHTAKQA